ncbi:MAG TPA: hypothetical protein VGK47_05175 [Nitrososphaeraceae archaeon]
MKQNLPNRTNTSMQKLLMLFSEGYVVNRISYPPTSDGSASIMIDLIQSSKHEECLLTVFGEEALELSEYLKSSSAARQK